MVGGKGGRAPGRTVRTLANGEIKRDNDPRMRTSTLPRSSISHLCFLNWGHCALGVLAFPSWAGAGPGWVLLHPPLMTSTSNWWTWAFPSGISATTPRSRDPSCPLPAHAAQWRGLPWWAPLPESAVISDVCLGGRRGEGELLGLGVSRRMGRGL